MLPPLRSWEFAAVAKHMSIQTFPEPSLSPLPRKVCCSSFAGGEATLRCPESCRMQGRARPNLPEFYIASPRSATGEAHQVTEPRGPHPHPRLGPTLCGRSAASGVWGDSRDRGQTGWEGCWILARAQCLHLKTLEAQGGGGIRPKSNSEFIQT